VRRILGRFGTIVAVYLDTPTAITIFETDSDHRRTSAAVVSERSERRLLDEQLEEENRLVEIAPFVLGWPKYRQS
jgi:hypothetical protein